MHRQGGRGSGYRSAGPGQAYYHDNGGQQTVAAAAAYASWRGGNYLPGILRAPVHLQQHQHYPQHHYHHQQHVQGYQGQGNRGRGGRHGQGRQQALGVQGGSILKRPAGTHMGHGRGRGKGWGSRGKKNLTKEALDADLDQWRLKDKKFGATSLDADLDDYWKNRKDDTVDIADDKDGDSYPEEPEPLSRKDSGVRKSNGVGITRGNERHIVRERDLGEKAKKAVANGD